jgi:hypothetical protein
MAQSRIGMSLKSASALTPAEADGASAFGASAARGSDAHNAVYNVGKFFGVKFQPWGAVKVARAIGNAGRVISVVGGVLAVVAQIAEDRQQQQYRLQLRDARDGARSAYRDSALSVQAVFTATAASVTSARNSAMTETTRPSWRLATRCTPRPKNATRHAGLATPGTGRTSVQSRSILNAMQSSTGLPPINILSKKLHD